VKKTVAQNEETIRIKINKMLEAADWHLDGVNKNIEVGQAYTDYLLLDSKKFPLCILEAKRENINPLSAKDQARAYAEKQNARFVILSNGEISYLWDIQTANPQIITKMPSQESLEQIAKLKRDKKTLESEDIIPEYVALTQNSNLLKEPDYINLNTKNDFCKNNGYKILRSYQIDAIKAIQKSASKGNDRFLIEMATGLGKTVTAAAIIKMFLKTGNASRVLFLVDRLELERQAGERDLPKYLSKDYIIQIFKTKRNDWQKANVVVSTIQTFLASNKYKSFSPTDFDFVISDEAHRSISGDSRAVFDYFIGYKLGLTATPKDYLKNLDIMDLKDQRTLEKRILRDTYKTFGCESSEPTFKFSLPQGVKEGYLINPYVLDIKTNITTELLSKNGYAAVGVNESGEIVEDTVFGNNFEKKFFNENTNRKFCECFIENAELDPISNEIGKSIIFCVSQKHAIKITQILNEIAMQKFPSKYNSDFAKQVTSMVQDSQNMTVQFENNKLGGKSKFLEGYETSKTRVCVTVAMMTTGYDCSDLLNIAFMRPVFSPTDFVQMKGRGTRKHTFENQNLQQCRFEKVRFKLFDFFQNYAYFENDFNYDQILNLPSEKQNKNDSKAIKGDENMVFPKVDILVSYVSDNVKSAEYVSVPETGMRIDREFWGAVQKEIKADKEIKNAVENDFWEQAVWLVKQRYENKPELFASLEKIKKANNLDRLVTWREVLEKIFGIIQNFKNKDDLLEDECDKFISIYKPDGDIAHLAKNFIRQFVSDLHFRDIIENKKFAELNTYTGFSTSDYKNLGDLKGEIPKYIKENMVCWIQKPNVT
jgi:type I restriction enzyme R subunit